MLHKEHIRDIARQYGIEAAHIGEVIDSSHGEHDIRLTYVIDEQYVLHCYSSHIFTESYLQAISRLVQRHRSIGVWTPELISQQDSHCFLYTRNTGNRIYRCYMEEFSPYPSAAEAKTDLYAQKLEVLPFLGKLASKYSNTDLSEYHSMWSIIDLSPFDTEIDEKQENVDALCGALEKNPLASRIQNLNTRARNHIRQYFETLPRCVFQGDLNPTNILVDEKGRFKGIIDFNMCGTEVNVNCFLNESMYYFEENDFDTFTPRELFAKMNGIQDTLMRAILQYYPLNDTEMAVYEHYRFIIQVGFFPNVMHMIHLLKHGGAVKVTEFLHLLCDKYEAKDLEGDKT